MQYWLYHSEGFEILSLISTCTIENGKDFTIELGRTGLLRFFQLRMGLTKYLQGLSSEKIGTSSTIVGDKKHTSYAVKLNV